jgi:hypothetical protein
MSSLGPKEAYQETVSQDAHKIALELMKQLITLSSGVLALSATFMEEFQSPSWALLAILVASWLCLAASVFFGLQTISAIVKSRLTPDHDWSTGIGKTYAAGSKYCFVAGLALFALFAFISFITPNPCP